MRIMPAVLFLSLLVPTGAPCEAAQTGAPGGTSNLEREWLDESARPYWNNVKEPQDLRMGGMKWVDPALVPPLNLGNESKVPGRKKVARKTAKPAAKPGIAVQNTAQAAPGAQAGAAQLPPQTLNVGGASAGTEVAAPNGAGAAPVQQVANPPAAQATQNPAVSMQKEQIPPLSGRIPDKLGIYDNAALVAPPPLH